MKSVPLSDVKLAVDDLLSKRAQSLRLVACGATYSAMLLDCQKKIDALPPSLTGRKPLVDELNETDDHHDGVGNGVFLYTGAFVDNPLVRPEVEAAALRIRDAFIPSLGLLAESYATEAAVAREHRKALVEREADLKMFPLPGGGTLHDWVAAFLDAGEKLNTLLSQRADETPQANKGTQPAAKVRSNTLGILTRLRAALRDEVTTNPALPRDLEHQVFGYWDQLAETRAAAAKARKSSSTPAKS